MDGRVQEPVMKWLRAHFDVQWVDKITEAGPVAALAAEDQEIMTAICRRVDVSIAAHESRGIAIAAHDGCAGMPLHLSIEVEQTMAREAAVHLQERYPALPVLALWVDDSGVVTVLDPVAPDGSENRAS